jgi:hypothetical protein
MPRPVALCAQQDDDDFMDLLAATEPTHSIHDRDYVLRFKGAVDDIQI